MAIFNSYVKLPEGNAPGCFFFSGFVWSNMAKVEVAEKSLKELANLAGFFLGLSGVFRGIEVAMGQSINKC